MQFTTALEFAIPSFYQPAYLTEVEMRPMRLDNDGWTEVESDNDATAFSVYLNYDFDKAHKDGCNDVQPSEWVADFDNRKDAEKFTKLLELLLKPVIEAR